MIGYIFAILAMATGLVGMIIFGKKREKDELTTPVTAGFLFILLIGALTFFAKGMCTERGDSARSADYAIAYSRISALILGQYLAEIAPGTKALVIVDDKLSDDVCLKARLDGLKEGFGQEVTLAAVDSPAQEGPPTEKPMSPERRIHLRKKSLASQFDDLLTEHPDCNLIVSLIGLPQNPDEMAVWNMPPETRPKFALLRSDIRTYQGAILANAICAAVIARPEVEPDTVRPAKDPQAAFDLQFLLVTPENAAQLADQYGIFAP